MMRLDGIGSSLFACGFRVVSGSGISLTEATLAHARDTAPARQQGPIGDDNADQKLPLRCRVG